MAYRTYMKISLILLFCIPVLCLSVNAHAVMLIDDKKEAAAGTSATAAPQQEADKVYEAPHTKEIDKIRERKRIILQEERYRQRPPKKRPYISDKPPEELYRIKAKAQEKKATQRQPLFDKETLKIVLLLVILILIASYLYRSMTKKKTI